MYKKGLRLTAGTCSTAKLGGGNILEDTIEDASGMNLTATV
jgi:hypothetical protein